MESRTAAKSSFKLVVAVAPTPVRVPSHFPRVSRQSHPSANYKGDNEMIPGAVYRSGIYFTAEENAGKHQLGNHLFKTVRPVITSNGVPYL